MRLRLFVPLLLTLAGPAGASALEGVLVATGRVTPEPFELTLPAKVGLLEAGEERVLAFEVPGRLVHLAAEGASVAEGDELAALDAGLEKAQVRQAEARLREARSELTRASGLRQQNAASEKAAESAEIAVSLRQAERDAARERVRRRLIEAPFAGVVAKTHPELGEVVAAGTPVLELIDSSLLRLEVGVPGYQIARVVEGAPVHVTVPALAGQRLRGTVHRVAAAASSGQHLFEVEIHVNNPPRTGTEARLETGTEARLETGTEAHLRPGMSAHARIVTRRMDASIVVPLTAAVERSGERVVFFVHEGRAHAVAVDGAPMVGDRLVLSGALPYRQVVLRGQHHLRDGASVRVDPSVLEAVPKRAEDALAEAP